MPVSQRGRRRATYSPDNKRVRELSDLACHLYPDGQGDYVLPETETALHHAVAIITHLTRSGPRNISKWLHNFCKMRAPWLDPNDIDITKLRREGAESLGKKLGLTAELRSKLGIRTIRPCDQTAEEFKAAAQDRRRQRDRDYRRRKRQADGSVKQSRAEYLTQHHLSRTKPWQLEGISRAAWYRRRGDGTAKQSSPPTIKAAVRLAPALPGGTGRSPYKSLNSETTDLSQPTDLSHKSPWTIDWYRRRNKAAKPATADDAA